MESLPLSLKFENRYICILIDVIFEFLIYKYIVFKLYINTISDAVVVIICLVFSLIKIFAVSRDIKMKIALGIFYKKTPFEEANEYIKNDNRICKMKIRILSNSSFYNKYYLPVKSIENVKVKNAEYCILRDLTYLAFINMLLLFIISLYYHFMLIFVYIIFLIYFLFVLITKNKAKEFVLQILAENNIKYRRK